MSTKVRKMGGESVMRRGCLCSVSFYLLCKRCHTGWGKGSRMNIPERGRERRWWSGGCAFTENLQPVWVSARLTSHRSQWSDWSPSSHGHWAQVLEQCWEGGRGGKLHVRRMHSITGNQHYVRTFTSQMVQMLHKEPGRNACLSESDSSWPGNTLHFRQ